VFKIMTWNVENLFKPGASSGPSTQAIFDAKIQGLASTINAQVPDALTLQEIGDPAALDDLVQHLQGTWHRRVRNLSTLLRAHFPTFTPAQGSLMSFQGRDKQRQRWRYADHRPPPVLASP
jgi:hypothetical protein